MKRFPFKWAELATHYSTTLQYDVTRIGGYWAIIRILSKIRCSYKNYSVAPHACFPALNICQFYSCRRNVHVSGLPVLQDVIRDRQHPFTNTLCLTKSETVRGLHSVLKQELTAFKKKLLVVSISCSLAVASCFLPCRKMCGLDFCHRGMETLLSVFGRSLLKGAMWHMIASPI